MLICLNFCRLIQGQVTRAEVEETTFAMKRELSAIKQHDIDTHMKLEKANERVKILSDQLEDQSSRTPSLEEVSLKSEIIKQKQEIRQEQARIARIVSRGGRQDASSLPQAFEREYGSRLDPRTYGYSGLREMLQVRAVDIHSLWGFPTLRT